MERINDNTYKNVSGIYKIINTMNGKVYIGSTTDFRQRINAHIRDLETNAHGNKELQKEFNIYESKNFKYELLNEIEEKDIERLPLIEKKYIDDYRKLNGVYNKSDPTEEFWVKRTDVKKNKQGENNVSKPYLEGYLDGKFGHLIQPIKDILESELYVHSNEVESPSFEDISNKDVVNHKSLESVIKKWYKKNGIAPVNFPEYKREFRELYGITIEGWKDSFVKIETYEEIRRKRRYNLIEFKERLEEQKEKSPNRIKIEKKENTKHKKGNSAKPLSDKEIERKQIEHLLDHYEQILTKEFELLFKSMSEKVGTGLIISYIRVFNYIKEKISLEQLDEKLLDKALKTYLRVNLNLSIFSFYSDYYTIETLNKFVIDEREEKILNKEKGKEIMAFQKELKYK